MRLKFFFFFLFIKHTFLLSLSQHTQNTLQLYHEMSVIITLRRERKQSRHLDILYLLKNRLDALSSGHAGTYEHVRLPLRGGPLKPGAGMKCKIGIKKKRKEGWGGERWGGN